MQAAVRGHDAGRGRAVSATACCAVSVTVAGAVAVTVTVTTTVRASIVSNPQRTVHGAMMIIFSDKN